MHHAAEKTGLSIKQLGAIREIGVQMKMPFDEAVRSIAFFNQRIGEAIRMGGEAKRPFNDLKVALLDASGAERDSGAVLTDTLRAWKELPSVAQQGYEATVLFGRAGREAIPFLNKLSDALDEGGKQAPASSRNKTWKTRWSSTRPSGRLPNSHLKKMFTAIAGRFLPVLKDFANWLKGLTDDLSNVQNLAAGAGFVFREFAEEALQLYLALALLKDLMDGLNNVEFIVMGKTVELIDNLFEDWERHLIRISAAMLELVKSARDTAAVMLEFETGHFGSAAKGAGSLLKQWKDDLVSMADADREFYVSAFKDFETFAGKVSGGVASDALSTFIKMRDDLRTVFRADDKMWSSLDHNRASESAGREIGSTSEQRKRGKRPKAKPPRNCGNKSKRSR